MPRKKRKERRVNDNNSILGILHVVFSSSMTTLRSHCIPTLAMQLPFGLIDFTATLHPSSWKCERAREESKENREREEKPSPPLSSFFSSLLLSFLALPPLTAPFVEFIQRHAFFSTLHCDLSKARKATCTPPLPGRSPGSLRHASPSLSSLFYPLLPPHRPVFHSLHRPVFHCPVRHCRRIKHRT